MLGNTDTEAIPDRVRIYHRPFDCHRLDNSLRCLPTLASPRRLMHVLPIPSLPLSMNITRHDTFPEKYKRPIMYITTLQGYHKKLGHVFSIN